MKLATYFLTCADSEEATKIANALLEARLCACVKQTNITSTFHWEGAIQNSSEVLLLIESIEEKFDEIDKIVDELHSYDEYVLMAMPIARTTPGVIKWIEETLNI